jgi:hypothetical protein
MRSTFEPEGAVAMFWYWLVVAPLSVSVMLALVYV